MFSFYDLYAGLVATHLNLSSQLAKFPTQSVKLEVDVRNELHAIALLGQSPVLGPAHQLQLLVQRVQLAVPGGDVVLKGVPGVGAHRQLCKAALQTPDLRSMVSRVK